MTHPRREAMPGCGCPLRATPTPVLWVSLVVALVMCAAILLSAQTFRGGIETVEVTVSVVDAAGRLVTGLTKDDFEVYEDGDPQPITQFTGDRVPMSLGLLVDISDSMRGQPILDARQAFDRFVVDLLKPDDEAFVATFNHAPHALTPWTTPASGLRGSLDTQRPTGGTAMYDALTASLEAFARRHRSRAAVVVISDGADTASDITLRETRDRLRRVDAFVYAIAIDSEVGKQRAATRVSPEALRELTGPTGGYTEVVQSAADLPGATERIARELDSQYTLAYTAPAQADGTWRSIRVRVTFPGATARSRRGYYATPAARDRLSVFAPAPPAR